MKDEELDPETIAAANARLASMDLNAPAPITERKRKPRADAGKPRAAKVKEAAPVQKAHAVMTSYQRGRASELLQILEDAHQSVYVATEKYNRANGNLHAYLDELTEQ